MLWICCAGLPSKQITEMRIEITSLLRGPQNIEDDGSADQLSRFNLDIQGIAYFVKEKSEKYGDIKE